MAVESVEAVVYYEITLAVHVDVVAGQVDRVVALREEIHPREGDVPMRVTNDGLEECMPGWADVASRIAEAKRWPATWEFGY